MDRASYQVRINQWTAIIQEQASSALNKADWCRQNGISLRSFYYWQKKLRDILLESVDAQASRQLPVKQDAPVFCELSVPVDQAASSIVPHDDNDDTQTNTSSLIIEIRDCRIVVGNSVSKDALSSVIEVIRHV